MIKFIDEKDKRYSALTSIKRKKSVNGEKSLSGTIFRNEEVINNVDLGWRVEFEEERYVITYAEPIDNGNVVELEFDAVHEFFYDFLKSSVHGTLNGSHTMRTYLNFVFEGSGYTYLLDATIPAFEKENFGMENRLSLFNNLIKSTGAEFVVSGTIVRIVTKVGNDLSTVVRKGFNMQDIKIEKNIKDFITYRKGYGAFFDEEDKSLGRLEAEYTSPLLNIYGKLEGDPFIDERYSVEENLYNKIKDSVDNSYEISVQLTMEDLTKAGYKYKQPHEGDFIMAINEDLGFMKKIRIISYESEFDTAGELIDHQVVCGSEGLVNTSSDAKFDDIYDKLDKIDSDINYVYIAANGKNMIYRGPDEPISDKLVINDVWYKAVGNGEHVMHLWTGAYWEEVILEDARFNNLDANNMTAGTLRGGSVDWNLDSGELLMGNSISDYALYFNGTNLFLGESTSINWGSINGKPSIPSKPSDIGAKPDVWVPTWNDVTGKPYVPTDSYITNITKDTITTSYINALGVRAKSLLAGTINIGNNAFQVDVDGWLHAGRGGFSVPPNSDGIYNKFLKSDSYYPAARWKYDDENYIYQDGNGLRFYISGKTNYIFKKSEGHTIIRLGTEAETSSTIKSLGLVDRQVQFRNGYDSAYIPVAASNFKVASSAKIKKDITYCKSKLDIVKNTPVFNFRLKDDKSDTMNTGFIVEDSPKEITTKLGDEDGISIVDTVATLWKAVQELSDKVEHLEGIIERSD